MAGAGDVVAHRLWRVLPEEDGPGVANGPGERRRIASGDLEVLARAQVGHCGKVRAVGHQNHQPLSLQCRACDDRPRRGGEGTIERGRQGGRDHT